MESSEMLFENVLTEKKWEQQDERKKKKRGKVLFKVKSVCFAFWPRNLFDEKYSDKILFKLQLYDCGMYILSILNTALFGRNIAQSLTEKKIKWSWLLSI